MKTFRDERSAAMAAAMAAVVPRLWAQEIDRAIDRVKNAGKRTPTDQWFRRAWYKQQWRMRNVKGPRVGYD